MARLARSAKGLIIDFDLLAIQQQTAATAKNPAVDKSSAILVRDPNFMKPKENPTGKPAYQPPVATTKISAEATEAAAPESVRQLKVKRTTE